MSKKILGRAAALTLSVIAVLVAASPALARTGYERVSTIAGLGAGDGQISSPGSIAVQSSTRYLFVADSGNNRVQVLSYDGAPYGGLPTYLTQFGAGALDAPAAVAVDQSTGDVYVADAGNDRIVRYQSDGLPTPTFTRDLTYSGPAQGTGSGEVGSFHSALAVDPTTQNLLVADGINKRVQAYDPSGAFVSSLDGATSPGGAFTGPLDVAVDSTGNVVVVDVSSDTNGNGEIDTGDLAFAGATSRVDRFAPGGAHLTSFTDLVQPATVAITPRDEIVVSDNEDSYNSSAPLRVSVFDEDASPTFRYSLPDAGATLYSHVTGMAVDAQSGSLYVATERGDSNFGITSLQLLKRVNVPATGAASAITGNSATLEGAIDPEGIATTFHFDYGPDSSYGARTAESDPPLSGHGDQPVAQDISGLEANKTYHYRLVSTSVNGTVNGTDQAFVTDAAPPVVAASAGVTSVTFEHATFHATINPANSETTYHFEYGPTASYGMATDPASAGSGSSDQQVSQLVTGLQPETIYHFKVVADNGTGGPVDSSDETFTTADAPPAVATGAVSSVTTSSASLAGTVDTQGHTGTYRFTVAQTDGGHQQATADVPLSAIDGPQSVTGSVSDLPADGHFVVRLAATTSGGLRSGAAVAFATAAKPVYVPPVRGPDDPAPYGCQAPKLNPFNGTVKPGETISLSGSDLGTFGDVAFGTARAEVVDYGAGRIDVTVPAGARGAAGVAVSCGRTSNTIVVKVASTVSNRFTAKPRVRGTGATIAFDVPGKGALKASGRLLGSASKTASGRGTVRLKLHLGEAGREALRRSPTGRLTVHIRLSFKPRGGTTRTTTRSLTFHRSGR